MYDVRSTFVQILVQCVHLYFIEYRYISTIYVVIALIKQIACKLQCSSIPSTYVCTNFPQWPVALENLVGIFGGHPNDISYHT